MFFILGIIGLTIGAIYLIGVVSDAPAIPDVPVNNSSASLPK